jgi:hypothetical protein
VGNPVAKLSVSVPHDLGKAVRKRVGTRGLSRLVARAMRHELEHEQLESHLGEMNERLGPVPKKTLAAARAACPKR